MNLLRKARKFYRLSRRTDDGGLPRILILYVTSSCNQSCTHCFYADNLNQKTDLKFDEIEKISRDLGQVDNILVGGGEPFTRTELPDILRLFYENNGTRTFSIPTNGTLLGRMIPTIEAIMRNCPEARVNVNFSFDGLEETHNEIRQFHDGFERSMKNCEKILAHFHGEDRLHFSVTSTIMDKNVDEMIDLSDYIEKRFSGDLPIMYGFLRGEPKDKALSLPPVKDLRKVHKNAVKQRKAASLLDKVIYNALFELKIATLKKQTQVVPCRAGELMGVIYADGTVSSCEILDTIGSVRDYDSLGDLWKSENARKQRQSIRNKECVCTHECFMGPSLTYHGKAWFTLPYYYLRNKVATALSG